MNCSLNFQGNKYKIYGRSFYLFAGILILREIIKTSADDKIKINSIKTNLKFALNSHFNTPAAKGERYNAAVVQPIGKSNAKKPKRFSYGDAFILS